MLHTCLRFHQTPASRQLPHISSARTTPTAAMTAWLGPTGQQGECTNARTSEECSLLPCLK